jgi:hypothetical protein
MTPDEGEGWEAVTAFTLTRLSLHRLSGMPYSVDPTSQVCLSTMLVLLIAVN